MRLVRIDAELVLDLNLRPWCMPVNDWSQWYLIDRRRLRRELRRCMRALSRRDDGNPRWIATLLKRFSP